MIDNLNEDFASNNPFFRAFFAIYDSFWSTTVDCWGKLMIDPTAKFLATMKLISYGVSFQHSKSIIRVWAWQNCALKNCVKASPGILPFETTIDICLHEWCEENNATSQVCLWYWWLLWLPAATKIHWAASPAAWKEQFENKEGYPTICLKAVAWIWHNTFHFAGTLNNIHIWDRSQFYISMFDGSHDKLEFAFGLMVKSLIICIIRIMEYIMHCLSPSHQTLILPQLLVAFLHPRWKVEGKQ